METKSLIDLLWRTKPEFLKILRKFQFTYWKGKVFLTMNIALMEERWNLEDYKKILIRKLGRKRSEKGRIFTCLDGRNQNCWRSEENFNSHIGQEMFYFNSYVYWEGNGWEKAESSKIYWKQDGWKKAESFKIIWIKWTKNIALMGESWNLEHHKEILIRMLGRKWIEKGWIFKDHMNKI